MNACLLSRRGEHTLLCCPVVALHSSFQVKGLLNCIMSLELSWAIARATLGAILEETATLLLKR
jgi:hypothetical protein